MFLTVIFCGNIFVFAATTPSPKETVLEDPYKSARQNETKYIDVGDNLSAIYRKSRIIANNFNFEKIIKIFLVKINLLKV
ncbi:MAG: hypothetical protein LBS61_01915 [Endomicrobium sp.]|nr:hypothetical protein [Endomicrobium sp.]